MLCTDAAALVQTAVENQNSCTCGCAGDYFIDPHVLGKPLADDEFLWWSKGGGETPWWHMGAEKAPRRDWYVRLALADGSGYVVLQGQSDRVQKSKCTSLTGRSLVMA